MYQVIKKEIIQITNNIDKLDISKLETTPIDLIKLSDVVKNDFAKRTKYKELVKKRNDFKTTDKSDLVKKL